MADEMVPPRHPPGPGQVVRVGSDVGVVVDVDPARVPADHLPVWYGECADGRPRIRTVPVEYCQPVTDADLYH